MVDGHEKALEEATRNLRAAAHHLGWATDRLRDASEHDLVARSSIVTGQMERLTEDVADRYGEAARRRLQVELLSEGDGEVSGVETRAERIVPLRQKGE